MLAALAFARGDCPAAASEFAQSSSVIRSQTHALEEYGSCLVKLNRPAGAIPVFDRLAAMQTGNTKAQYNLALVESMAGRYPDAIETLSRLVQQAPHDSDSLALLSESYEATGDTPKAVAALRQAIVSKPDVPGYYLDFANLSLVHASYQVGIDMLNAGLKRLPNSASLYLARGILAIQMGNYRDAERDFTRAEQLDANIAYGSSARGLAELQRNDLPQAETTVRSRLAKQPANAFLHYLLAEILLRRGAAPGTPQFEEARRSALRAVQLQPDLALARDALARLYLQEDRPDEAIKQSRAAFEADPSDQTALYHLILALRKSGKSQEVPALAKKLAELREQARTKEARERKYALIEPH